MIRRVILPPLLLLCALPALAQGRFALAPLLQQTGLYFSSDRVTVDGLGAGMGVQGIWNDNFLAQGDVNILWANGNAITTRLAAGVKSPGKWSPAILGTCAFLWGQRTEVLSSTGERPASPVWVLGLRVAPLRFEGAPGFVSVLEFGAGIGPDRGLALEATILSIGATW